ncbi:MAG: polysaccharide deacetylase family protein [Acidobacteriota bacterium]
MTTACSRRSFLTGVTLTGCSSVLKGATALANPNQPALISISIDLEMARNYPSWEDTHWDYEKGNLDAASKRYSVQAAGRVKDQGGRIHFFAVGRVFEQEDVGWLKEIADQGHPIGNHTYDHVNIRARKAEALQPRFRRAPWLIHGKAPLEVIRENIWMTSQALRGRLGVDAAGFRAPGGFPNGLKDYPEVQKLLLDLGFEWASTQYVYHPVGVSGYVPEFTPLRDQEPPADVYQAVLEAHLQAQPSVYPSGLIEIPMCPISDLIAFRTGRWRLPHFLKAIRQVVHQTIERRLVWVFLGHPSCLSVTDPEYQTINLICDLVRDAGESARLVTLETIAEQVKAQLHPHRRA